MPKLNKPRGFEVSKNTEILSISGKEYEIANLLKGGLMNQSKVLIAVDDVWREIDVLNHGADNSNLQAFINHVEIHNLKLADFGIEESKPDIDYNLKHEDFMELEKLFPDYSYIQIAKLDKYVKEGKGNSGMYSMKQDFKMLTRDKISIDDFIANTEIRKKRIINGEMPNTYILNMEKQKRINELISYNLVSDAEGNYEGHGFYISHEAIEKDTPEDWPAFMERIKEVAGEPALETPTQETHEAVPVTNQPADTSTTAKKPISLSVISTLEPSRISELKGLKEKQEAIVLRNPIITPIDKKTRDEAQKQVAELLKASTAIDGKTGILANFVTHANQFIKMGKDYLTPLAKITRDQHDKQKKLVTEYDSKEEIRIQNEKKAELTKIKERTDRLFKVPFAFNGSLYSIGTLYVLPSDVEKLTDEEFDAKIKEGELLIEAAKKTDDAKNDAIRKAAETLRQYNAEAADQILIDAGLMEPKPAAAKPATQTAAPAANQQRTSVSSAPKQAIPSGFATAPAASAAIPANTPAANTAAPARFSPSKEYTLPDPSNIIVNTFDMQHFGLVNEDPIKPSFISHRAYFIEGSRQMAIEIEKILEGEKVVNGLKQSERITNLCKVVKAAV